MKKASVIIQARMGSSRLPDKVLMPLAGKPVLEHVIRRCQQAQCVDRVVVATTVDPQDIAIVNLSNALGVGVFCGSTDDVLDRFYQTAKLFNFQHVVRITADCPLIDPFIVDKVISRYFEDSFDYVSNTLVETYPDGQDVEVFSFAALRQAWCEARLVSEREHVTPFLKKNEVFKKTNVLCETDLSRQRLTLDEARDYEKLAAIFSFLYPKDPYFHMHSVLDFLDGNPSIDEMNRSIKRNEGYEKSLKSDGITEL